MSIDIMSMHVTHIQAETGSKKKVGSHRNKPDRWDKGCSSLVSYHAAVFRGKIDFFNFRFHRKINESPSASLLIRLLESKMATHTFNGVGQLVLFQKKKCLTSTLIVLLKRVQYCHFPSRLCNPHDLQPIKTIVEFVTVTDTRTQPNQNELRHSPWIFFLQYLE